MHSVPPLVVMDYIGPVIGAVVFVVVMSLVREPTRRMVNVVLVAGAAGVYMSGGGFGRWEVLYPLIATPVVYLGFRSYRFIAAAWFMHAGWDLVHHVWGNPIWPFMPTSSLGCLIFDSLIAVWFLREAPSLVAWGARSQIRPSATLEERSAV
jgi:hypothetical protein